ncbi:MAG: efflux RND transporter periplasmic adaptor subunit [Chloroflexota bacterium]|nr:efflux RND transporter periplasmic adaptor subunit [Chloroflexota bacterium]
MKRRIFFKRNVVVRTGLLLGLLILSLVACGQGADDQSLPTSVPSDVVSSYQSTTGNIAANGVLWPAQQVGLSFDVGGSIDSVEVEVGQNVQAGQTLAVLDTTDLQRGVAQAELELETARTRLARLQAQATPVPERVLAATAAITSAQAALTQADAQAGQRGNQDVIDRWELEHAARALQDAQNEYDKVLDNPRTHTWAPSSPQARDLEEAQDHYDVVLARYNMRAADHSYAVAIAAAESQLAQAQLALYEAQHPVTSEEIVLAQLDVERAQLALEAAQANLAQTTLTAPFDGVVAAVPVNVGEWAAPGATVVELLDVSRWRIETKNVGELEIARVRVGQEVEVRVNAFREETLNGRVVTISPVAVVQQGDTTYTLMIELEPTDLNLRPGMTAQVEVVAK